MFAVGGAPGAQWQQAMLKGPEAAAGVAEGGVHTPNTASPVREGMVCGSGSELSQWVGQLCHSG